MSLDQSLLENVKQVGDKTTARCPACAEQGHDKKGDHLCIMPDGKYGCAKYPDDAAHRKRIYALKGQKKQTPTRAVSSNPTKPAQTWPDIQTAATACTPRDHKLVDIPLYPKNGKPFLAVARYESENDKQFRQFKALKSGWQLGAPSKKNPLYQESDIPPTGDIYLVEGEKCVEAVKSIGLPATTTAGGSGAANKTDFSILAGRDVIIMPDNDEPGEKYCVAAKSILAKLNPPARVRTLRLPGLQDGEDIVEYLEARDCMDADALRADIEKLATATVDLPSEDAATYIEEEPLPIDPIIEDVCEAGDKIELIGGSKRRKSFLMIELAIHIAIGRDWMGLRIPKRRKVLLINLELKRKWIHRRIRRACRAHGVDPAVLRGWLLIINARSRGAIVRAKLVEIATREKAEFVIVDPRYKLMLPGEIENAGEGLQGILDLLDRVAESGPAVATVHHDGKGDAGDRAIADRGAGSGWSGRDVDARIAITPQKMDPDEASVISIMARNFAPVPDFTIRWENDRFVLDSELQPVPYTSYDRKRALHSGTKLPPEHYEQAALEAAREPMSRAELIIKLQAAGANRDTARACIDGLVRKGDITSTPRTGQPKGAVKYGRPEVIRKYMNPDLKL